MDEYLGEEIHVLIEQLSHPMALVRSSAAKQLGEAAAEKDVSAAVPSLMKALEDKDTSVRRRAADSLGAAAFYGYNISSAIPMLAEVLQDTDTMAMKNAARALNEAAEKGHDITSAISALAKLRETSFEEREDDFTKLAKEYAAKAIDFASQRAQG